MLLNSSVTEQILNIKTIRFVVLLILMIMSVYELSAQTVGDYHSAASGNWSTLATWARWNGSLWVTPTVAQGTPTNATGAITIQSPNIVSVTASVSIDQLTVSNGATLTINSSKILTVANGTGVDLMNNGTINNNGTVAINGQITNNNIYNEGNLTSVGYTTSSGTFTNSLGASFNVLAAGELEIGYSATRLGTFNNFGSLINNSPSTVNPGILVNTGSLINSGTILNNAGSTITNMLGTISTAAGFVITNNGIFNNQSNVYIDGTFNNNGTYNEYALSVVGNTTSGIFNNTSGASYTLIAGYLAQLYIGTSALITGTVNNAGTITNNTTGYASPALFFSGIVVAFGSLTNTGVINNNGGYWTTTSVVTFSTYGLIGTSASSTITNTGTINNTGALALMGGSTLNNSSGGIYNSSAYTVIDGSLFNNTGTFNENFETFNDASGSIVNNSSGSINIANTAVINFSSALASLTNNKGSLITNLGTYPGFPGLMLNVANTSLSNSGTIIDNGNILNNGSFSNNGIFIYQKTSGSITGTNYFTYGATGVLDYNGIIAQTTSNYEFPASTGPANVTIDNSNAAGVTMHADRSISTLLNLLNGPLFLNSHTLTMVNPAVNGITRTSGFILSNYLDQAYSSKLQWNIGTTKGDHVFPFGVNVSSYIPFTFSVTSAATLGNVTVSTYEAGSSASTAVNIYTNKPALVTNLDGGGNTGNPGDAANIIKRFWRIETTASGTATVTFTYPESEIPVNGEDPNSMYAQRFNTVTNSWDAPLISQTSNTTSNTVVVTNVSSFSPWAISRGSHLLPIVYLNYNATYSDGKVNVDWSTSSETNNDYYTIEKSSDLNEVTSIGTVAGAGNSNVVLNYRFVDDNPGTGTVYYRIRQTDYDGTTDVSKWMEVKISTENNISVFGDNASGNISVIFSGVNEDYLISVFDLTGNCIAKTANAQGGENTVVMHLPGVSTGIYIVNITSRDKTISKKIQL